MVDDVGQASFQYAEGFKAAVSGVSATGEEVFGGWVTAGRFLACFSPDTRYFISNCPQTFIVAFDRRIAGLW